VLLTDRQPHNSHEEGDHHQQLQPEHWQQLQEPTKAPEPRRVNVQESSTFAQVNLWQLHHSAFPEPRDQLHSLHNVIGVVEEIEDPLDGEEGDH